MEGVVLVHVGGLTANPYTNTHNRHINSERFHMASQHHWLMRVVQLLGVILGFSVLFLVLLSVSGNAPPARTMSPTVSPTRIEQTSPSHTLPSAVIPAVVEVPAGPFLMGSSEGDKRAMNNDEKPQHTLTLPTYWIGKTEVTNDEFRPFARGDGYTNRTYWTDDGWAWLQSKHRNGPSCLDDTPKGDHPVVCVTWYEAAAYCRWLSVQTGMDFRLPSEAEWEKAARGTDGRIYPWGNIWVSGRAQSGESGQGFPGLVGRYRAGASPYGAMDMAGNVMEWTRSAYRDYPYDPNDGREAEQHQAHERITLRGGAWVHYQEDLRVTKRDAREPDEDGGYATGFRIARYDHVRPTAVPPLPTPTNEPPLIPTNGQGEPLIVIATFRSVEGNHTSAVHTELQRMIREALPTVHMPAVRVEIAADTVAADDRAGAANLGAHTNASIVIWGEVTGSRSVVNILSRHEPASARSNASLNQIQLHRLTHPDGYISFHIQDLISRMPLLTLFAISQSAIVQQDYPSATQIMRQAITMVQDVAPNANYQADADVRKEMADALFRLGWLYQGPGHDPVSALGVYNQAITLDPTYAPSYNNRGMIAYDQKQMDQALADYNQAITLDPTFALAYKNRGNVYLDQQQQDQALADYTQAIALDPRFASAYNNRGTIYAARKQMDQALADYNQAIALDPTLIVTYRNRGLLYYEQDQFDRALTNYKRNTMSDPIHGRYVLPAGRVVYLTRLLLTPTYEGVLEGSPALVSQHIRERLASSVPYALGIPAPFVVIDDGAPALPPYRWVASFRSPRAVQRVNDPDYESQLTLCWFTAAIPADIHALFAEALSEMDWDASAEDYDIMP